MSDGLKVIGAGLHRTGSMSVKAALERLGYGPCYHGMEALRRNTDGAHWMAALEAGGTDDWSVIFDGYRAAVDWPTAHFWEQLAAAYPDAKILLTDRDPESWWASHQEMFRVGLAFNEAMTEDELAWAQRTGFDKMQTALMTSVAQTFDGEIFDKEHCLRAYERHYERVRASVPAERLLVYRVQEGWEPLCRFLGAGVPDEPFPRVNVGGDLHHNIATAMRLARERAEEPTWR